MGKIISKMCEVAGIGGRRTNHSLRSTAATRMYQCGLEEHEVAQVTRHTSVAVESYKRTSDKQKRNISEILYANKIPKDDNCAVVQPQLAGNMSQNTHELVNPMGIATPMVHQQSVTGAPMTIPIAVQMGISQQQTITVPHMTSSVPMTTPMGHGATISVPQVVVNQPKIMVYLVINLQASDLIMTNNSVQIPPIDVQLTINIQ